MECHLSDHPFNGMVKNLRDSKRYKYGDSSVSYIKFLVAARKVETEVIDSKVTTTDRAWS